MSKHTPGPWVAKNSGPHWNNNKIDNWTVHHGNDGEHIVDHVYEDADARLIAAAPELLEALQDLADRDFGSSGWDSYMDAIALRARAAIAKAKGEK